MQTFLPYPSYVDSARVLDRQRLGKQRVEVLQLLKALSSGGAWSNHPAAKMWQGHESALVMYGLIVCGEWVVRGYRDTCREKIAELGSIFPATIPPIFSDEFHAAHRAALLAKNPEWYGQFGWTEEPKIDYSWPVGGH